MGEKNNSILTGNFPRKIWWSWIIYLGCTFVEQIFSSSISYNFRAVIIT